MRKTLAGGLVALLVIAASACHDDERVTGTCHVYEYDIAADYKERKDYCASKSDCDAFCASVIGQQNYPGCEYEDTSYCAGDALPAPKAQRVCALYQSIVCGGGSDNFQPHCDTSCTEEAGSDYDPSTDCLIQYRGPIVEGTTCDDALGKLGK
jgi:hypothetical protein